MDLEIRAPTSPELKLIKHSWFKSMQQKSDLGRLIRPDLFSPGANELIDRLSTANPPVVATLEAVPEEVLGWCVRSFDAVHYCYVKHDFRRQGVARRLTFGAKYYTIRTTAGTDAARKLNLLFNPFHLWSTP